MGPREASNLLWGLGRLGHVPPREILSRILVESVKKLPDMHWGHVSQCAVGVALLRGRMETVRGRAMERMGGTGKVLSGFMVNDLAHEVVSRLGEEGVSSRSG